MLGTTRPVQTTIDQEQRPLREQKPAAYQGSDGPQPSTLFGCGLDEPERPAQLQPMLLPDVWSGSVTRHPCEWLPLSRCEGDSRSSRYPPKRLTRSPNPDRLALARRPHPPAAESIPMETSTFDAWRAGSTRRYRQAGA